MINFDNIQEELKYTINSFIGKPIPQTDYEKHILRSHIDAVFVKYGLLDLNYTLNFSNTKIELIGNRQIDTWALIGLLK